MLFVKILFKSKIFHTCKDIFCKCLKKILAWIVCQPFLFELFDPCQKLSDDWSCLEVWSKAGDRFLTKFERPSNNKDLWNILWFLNQWVLVCKAIQDLIFVRINLLRFICLSDILVEGWIHLDIQPKMRFYLSFVVWIWIRIFKWILPTIERVLVFAFLILFSNYRIKVFWNIIRGFASIILRNISWLVVRVTLNITLFIRIKGIWWYIVTHYLKFLFKVSDLLLIFCDQLVDKLISKNDIIHNTFSTPSFLYVILT